ncbi:unnamed protein product [Urochloa humidicola]
MGFCNDQDLIHLVQRAPSLKSLNIQHYSIGDNQTGDVLVEALKKLTLLEDLQIFFQYRLHWDPIMLQSVCKACPRLKRLVILFEMNLDLDLAEDEYEKQRIDRPIPVMPSLHILVLDYCYLSCKGLNAILDSCPLLQTLTIYGYFNKSLRWIRS